MIAPAPGPLRPTRAAAGCRPPASSCRSRPGCSGWRSCASPWPRSSSSPGCPLPSIVPGHARGHPRRGGPVPRRRDGVGAPPRAPRARPGPAHHHAAGRRRVPGLHRRCHRRAGQHPALAHHPPPDRGHPAGVLPHRAEGGGLAPHPAVRGPADPRRRVRRPQAHAGLRHLRPPHRRRHRHLQRRQRARAAAPAGRRRGAPRLRRHARPRPPHRRGGRGAGRARPRHRRDAVVPGAVPPGGHQLAARGRGRRAAA